MLPARIRSVLILGLLLVACRDRTPQTPKFSQVFPNLPLPPQPTFVSRAGGPDALQFTFHSPEPADQVAAYYRKVFKQGGWKLVSDAKDADGVVVLLAEQKGPPLWVRIRKSDSGQGSVVELAGAVLAKKDSTGARKPNS
ncbi:MAG TPA: hypothetical protein VH763_16165 [Gemmatimonadales bacterium]|jgi:hypothetical protein